jgi:WD40 repeat protein
MNLKKSVLSIAFVFVVLISAIEVSALAGNDSVRYPHTNILQYRSHTLFDTGVISETSSMSSPMPERWLSSPITGGVQGRGKILWIDKDHQNAVAQHAAMSGSGEYIMGGWWLNNSRAALYETSGAGSPLWTHRISTNFYVPVDASFDGNVITATGWGDRLYMFEHGSSTPLYTESYPAGYSGIQSATSTIGNVFLGAAFFDSDLGIVQCYDAVTGDELWTFEMERPEGLRVSANGAFTVANSRPTAYVVETANGNLRGTVPIPGDTQTPAAISGDGSIVVTGAFDGQVRVYEWNGSEYEPLWNHYTGHSWVMAVEVSDDGSTVMAGTLGFNPYRGKVLMYDISSSEPLWEYLEYGDSVDDVSLSPNGSVGVAGSWGQYGGTSGDIFSAFSRDSAVPIFKMEDDFEFGIGSIFAVEISDNASYAVASGKAVHAREFGHGGMVIAVSLGNQAPVLINVYDTPESIAPGDVARWTIEIVNNTEEAQVVDVWLTIEGDHLPPWWDPRILLIEGYSLPGGQSRSGTVKLKVHPKAPAGTYTVWNLVGEFPRGAVNWVTFDCEVVK